MFHRLTIAVLALATGYSAAERTWLAVGLGVALLTWLVLEDGSPFEVDR